MTALDAKVRATGLIAYKALIDHALENGLPAPTSMDITAAGLGAWIPADAAVRWIDSIHIDDETTRPSTFDGREIVHVAGRLPLLGVRVVLKFSRPVVRLQAVS